MAVLTPREGPDTRRPDPRRTATDGSELGPAEPTRRILLVSRDDHLDSLLARRRVAAHLGDLRPVHNATGRPLPVPDVALVCDDEAATNRLLESGVPVVHLTSGHEGTTGTTAMTGTIGTTAASGTTAADGAAGRALHRVHRPGWLPDPATASTDPRPNGVRPTGLLAPARSARKRERAGTLLLLSAWDVPDAEADTFITGTLPTLVREALRRTGRCDVVGDTRLTPIRAALAGLAGRPEVRVSRAVDVDVDALHAGAEVFLAAPTLGALALAQARRAPLVFLPALGDTQRDLAARVRHLVPVPPADDPEDDAMWVPPARNATALWSVLDPDLDDLRGAQRVARTLRQLSLAPL
ncbi:CGA synthase-related protein [Embleya sp. NPDC127516]|uniref:CGA synthase-related protein n=1 Tax=Embleya sp. NPDC127516 TaxID=3363990 RepID=UPI0037FFC070